MWTNVLLPLSLLRHKPWMLVLLQTSFHVMVCRSDQHLIYLRSQKMKSAINLGSTRLPPQSCWLVVEKGWESSKRLLKLSQKRLVLIPSDHICVQLHLRVVIEFFSWNGSPLRLSSSHQLIIICGRNIKLAEKLSSRAWPLRVLVKARRFDLCLWARCPINALNYSGLCE